MTCSGSQSDRWLTFPDRPRYWLLLTVIFVGSLASSLATLSTSPGFLFYPEMLG